MLFKRAIFSACAVTALVAAGAFLFLVRIHSSDIPLYRKLVSESAELLSRKALERHPTHQAREGVQKDIWAVDGAERLHFRLNSDYSELTLRQKKDKVEAVEELQGINCWIQEKIDRGAQTQQIRTIAAAEGSYYYPSHRFLANTVQLAFYRVPGTELPRALLQKPFLKGVAREASFAATGKIPTFTAYHITAQLDPERGLP